MEKNIKLENAVGSDEILFENRFKNSPAESLAMMLEYYKRQMRIFRVIADILAVLLILCLIYTVCFKHMSLRIILNSLLCVILLAIVRFLYFFQARMTLHRAKRMHHGDLEVETVWNFTEETINASEGDISLSFAYDKISTFMEMDGYYAFILNRFLGNAILVKKSCFTIGSEEEFIEFMQKKCPKLQKQAEKHKKTNLSNK